MDDNVKDFIDDALLLMKVEQKFEYSKWIKEIPFLQFKPEWKVKIIPPSGGAIVRFLVEWEGKQVSVYLDCYDRLGVFGEPYWEMYLYDNTFRCAMNDTTQLIGAITLAFGNKRVSLNKILTEKM